MGCLMIIMIFAIFEFFDWCLAQLCVFAASKAFGFDTNIWQVVLVFLAFQVLSIFVKSAGSSKKE